MHQLWNGIDREAFTMMLAIPFLLCVVIAGPFLGLLGHFHPNLPRVALRRTTLLAGGVVLCAFLTALAALAGFGADIETTWNGRIRADHIVLASELAFIAFCWNCLLLRLRGRDARAIRMAVPRSALQWVLRMALVIIVPLTVEYAYRGVLFELFSRLTETWLLSAVLSAVPYALAHGTQPYGWANKFAMALFGVGMQWLVLLSGGLWLAVIAHLWRALGIEWIRLRKAWQILQARVTSRREIQSSL